MTNVIPNKASRLAAGKPAPDREAYHAGVGALACSDRTCGCD
jgi:hypothetical protein